MLIIGDFLCVVVITGVVSLLRLTQGLVGSRRTKQKSIRLINLPGVLAKSVPYKRRAPKGGPVLHCIVKRLFKKMSPGPAPPF